MNITREFTVGDRLTSLSAKLYRPSGEPVVLGAGETVAFRMISAAGTIKVNDQAATIVTRGTALTGAPAEVRYDWAAADVDTAGEYVGWFIRTDGGLTEHFPPQNPDDPEFTIIFYAVT
jgi:hypothetical protein